MKYNMKKNLTMNDEIKLKSVTKNDYKFLFELLAQRDPRANISHREMPTYQRHIRFVKSKPYAKQKSNI